MVLVMMLLPLLPLQTVLDFARLTIGRDIRWQARIPTAPKRRCNRCLVYLHVMGPRWQARARLLCRPRISVPVEAPTAGRGGCSRMKRLLEGERRVQQNDSPMAVLTVPLHPYWSAY